MGNESAVRLYGYTIGARIASNCLGDVYAAVRDADARPVILKVARASTENEPSRVKREHDMIRRIASERIPRVLGLELAGDHEVLVVTWFNGMNLREYATKARPALRELLAIAIQVAEALIDIHRAGIVHSDINPRNVLIDPETLDVRVIDFGISTELGQTTPPTLIAGTFRYIAPEQIGRLALAVDGRTDLYSLGATIYELLVGEPPFACDTIEEMLQAHLSTRPVPPRERAPDTPHVLSEIVMKLLAKDPLERYQTAGGLRADLHECSRQLLRRGHIGDGWPLGTHDLPDRIELPAVLYDREAEIETLRAAHARAAAGGCEVVHLRGQTGMGKTALLRELSGIAGQRGGEAVRGTFEGRRHARIYAAVVDAFEQLFDRLLAEGAASVDVWRARLSARLGDAHAATLAAVSPTARLLLATQGTADQRDPAPELAAAPDGDAAASEAGAVAGALRALVAEWCTHDRPLVLMLDDVHLADAASARLLEHLLAPPAPSGLLLATTFCTATGDVAAHPWERTIRAAAEGEGAVERAGAEQTAANVTTLELGPLSSLATRSLVADALSCAPRDVAWLADRISARTHDAPKYIGELLLNLQQSGALRRERNAWVWDEAAVERAAMPEQAVHLARQRIAELPDRPRALLEVASCFGASFPTEQVLDVMGAERACVFEDLMHLAQAGLIAPCPEGFQFVHQAVQDACQARLSAAERAALHRRIGVFLLSRTTAETLPRHAHQIALHLNRAGPAAHDRERLGRIELNLTAAERAVSAGDSKPAEGHLRSARVLLREEDWTARGPLCARLQLCEADAALQGGRIEEAMQILSALELRPIAVATRAELHARQIRLACLLEGANAALERAFARLRAVGIRPPSKVSDARAWLAAQTARVIARLPACARALTRVAPEALAELRAVLPPALEVALQSDYRVATAIGARLVRLHAAAGGDLPPRSVLDYARSTAALAGDPTRALAASRRALELARHAPVQARIEVELATHTCVRAWLDHRRSLLEPLEEIERRAVAAGRRQTAVDAWLWRCVALLCVGEPLTAVVHALMSRLDAARRLCAPRAAAYEGMLAALRPLLLEAEQTGDAKPEPDSEAAARALAAAPELAGLVHTTEVLSLYLLDRPEDAWRCSARYAARAAYAAGGALHISELELFTGLVAAEMLRRSTSAGRRRLLARLRTAVERMRRWARHSEATFAHQRALLEGALLVARGAPEPALGVYLQAAEAATRERFHLHASIAHERRAATLLQLGRLDHAAEVHQVALLGYQALGAHGKVAALRATATRTPRRRR
jgi:hypothetical protein